MRNKRNEGNTDISEYSIFPLPAHLPRTCKIFDLNRIDTFFSFSAILIMAGLQIYFCGSMRGGRQDIEHYINIVTMLKQHGTVLTEFVADPNITATGSGEDLSDAEIYKRDMELLNKAEIMVAEVTQPSLGVGFEIGTAVSKGNIPILCLYREQPGKRLSALIEGLADGKKYKVHHYTETTSNLQEILQNFIQEHKGSH